MTTASTVTVKGQVTIPKEIRDRLGIRPGDRVEFVLERGVARLRKQVPRDPIDALYGSLKLPASVDELMDEMRGGPYRP
ncbi:MAG TPA: AbrB/MazE/SpoVT family DNA-binding domain-containing protein [Actinomycetota bacterium]|nr:AbrB/MazE/SpoVT family DNA-binding domain-containing protein [Actinomycetota bacterium]